MNISAWISPLRRATCGDTLPGRMQRRPTRVLLAVVAAIATWWLAAHVAGLAHGVAMLAPALLLLLPLLAGRYVGEELIDRLRTAVAPRRSRRRLVAPTRLRPVARIAVRGSLLMGAHLAQRPPPAQV